MLTNQQLIELNQRRPLRVIWDIFLCWFFIGINLYLCHLSWWYIPMALIMNATRLHALAVMMHDGAHYLLFKNKFINDLVSNLFCAFPLQLSTQVYRLSHNEHHRYTQTEDDPNYRLMQKEEAWNFPKSEKQVKCIILKDILLLNVRDHLKILQLWQIIPNYLKASTSEKILFPLYSIALITSAYYWQLWMPMIVLQASALFINPLARIRAMSEHVHVRARGQSKVYKLQETPTINASWVERFFFAPLNTNRHLEHHLYPTIPYYNLERAHQIIRESEDYKRHCRYELDGYFLGKKNAVQILMCIDENTSNQLSAA